VDVPLDVPHKVLDKLSSTSVHHQNLEPIAKEKWEEFDGKGDKIHPKPLKSQSSPKGANQKNIQQWCRRRRRFRRRETCELKNKVERCPPNEVPEPCMMWVEEGSMP
jgi:hypothetical protein